MNNHVIPLERLMPPREVLLCLCLHFITSPEKWSQHAAFQLPLFPESCVCEAEGSFRNSPPGSGCGRADAARSSTPWNCLKVQLNVKQMN